MSKKLTTEEFIEKSKKIHGDKYDYFLVEYVNYNTKIKIICHKHGIFNQSSSHHLNGMGCQKCFGGIRLTLKEFISNSKKVHGNKYDYSLVEYKNARTKVKIICKKHGVFEQVPQHHITGVGCPSCRESKGEKILVDILDKMNIKYVREKRFKECRYKNPLPFDFYLSELNTCIEYDGEQHFRLYKKFGGKEALEKQIIKDQIKNQFCLDNGIKLIRIRYDDNIDEKITVLVLLRS